MNRNKDSKEIQSAIRSLFKLTKKRLCLMVEDSAEPNVFLLVGIKRNGTIAYQVSNGMDGYRSTSFDCKTIVEAMDTFDRVCKEGWR